MFSQEGVELTYVPDEYSVVPSTITPNFYLEYSVVDGTVVKVG
jgi:hypothetical protein